MFIRAIVVPVLVICLVLFVGISYNNGNNANNDGIQNGMDDMNTNEAGTNGMNNVTDNAANDIATTPSLITNRNGLNMTDESYNDNNTTLNDGNMGLRETRIKNEVERINGIRNARVYINDNMVFIALLRDDAENITDISLRAEIRNVISNIDNNLQKIYVSFSESEYNNFYSGNNNNNFSDFMKRSEVITVY